MRSLLPTLLLASLLAGCGGPDSTGPVRGALLVTVGEGDCPAPPAPAGAFGLAFAPVSSDVLPSAASVLTGLPPPRHGLRVDGVGALDPAAPTLATRFRDAGHDCAAFLSDIALSPVHGLTNGFSVYSVAIAPTNRALGFRRGAAEVCAEARAWLDARVRCARPVFLWLHLPTFDEAALGTVLDRFADDAKVVALPFSPAGCGDLAERGLAAPEAPANGFVRNVPRSGRATVSAAAAPHLFGWAETEPALYWESLVPWYAFRLPPLFDAAGGAPGDVLDGLDAAPVALPLGHQTAMAALRARGHLGEGLIPPYTGGVARAGLDEAGAARVARWRAAMAAPAGTNRVAALRALAASDPDVPLFRQELGEALLREKDYTGACNELAAAARLGWNMVLANRLQARCHAAIGNVPAAIDRAEAAFLVNEGDGLVRRELSDLLLRTGAALLGSRQLVPARDCLARSLLLEPGRPDAVLLSARLDLAAARTNAALRTLDGLLAAHPRFKAASELRARLRTGGAK